MVIFLLQKCNCPLLYQGSFLHFIVQVFQQDYFFQFFQIFKMLELLDKMHQKLFFQNVNLKNSQW